MLKKILLGFVIFLVAFSAYVATRPADFRVERSGVIQAPAEKIFPYLVDFRLAPDWSPFDPKDAKIERKYVGEPGQVGSRYEFQGDSSVGAGHIELLKIEPNRGTDFRLVMTSPMAADNLIEYRLEPEASGGTRFTWTMSGQVGFLGKLVGVIIDCDKMVGPQFEKGIANLKKLLEAPSST